MKAVIVSLLFVGSVNAFAGYTAEVCRTNEVSQQVDCRLVHYNRALGVTSSNQEPVVYRGEGQNTIGEKPGAHVPILLQKINNFFKDRGYTARSNDGDTDKAGGC